ncbi:MAG: D-2-hydroxyacid dehydrogenase [Rhodospirillales bacterium]
MKLVYSLAWEVDPFVDIMDTFDDIEFTRANAKQGFGPEIEDAEALIMSATHYSADVAKELNDRAKKLRWMQSAAIGYDNYVKFGVPEGVALTTAAGLKGGAVSEHGFALLLALAHGTQFLERYRQKVAWENDIARTNITPLEGLTMAVIGYGSIGKEFARKAKAFDMNVIAVSRSGSGDVNADQAVTAENMCDALPEADVVCAALPANPESEHLLDAKAFNAMKKGALFVNVGRGTTHDEKALVGALQSGHLGGAGLDVYEIEPLPADSPLWGMENVVMSPHVAGTSNRTYALFVDLVRNNLERLKKGEELLNQVPAEFLKTSDAA